MRKRKQYFGARRRWPDSPRQQKLQVTWDIEAYSGVGNADYYIIQHLQSLEGDLMKGMASLSFNSEHLKGGIPRGHFFTTAGYNPNPQMMFAHRLQRAIDNGLQDKIMICLEDSYSTPHFVPYHDFDKLTVESPDDPLRTANWRAACNP
jgi:hypothetical protein